LSSRLVGAHDLARGEGRLARDHRLPLPGKKFNSPNDIVVRSDGSVYWTDSAGGLVIPGMVGEDLQRQLDIQAVFRLTPKAR
jgi:sugar lactone lactonase YvrE